MGRQLKYLYSALVGVLLLLWALPAFSADLRGRVDTQNPYTPFPFPLSHATVYLLQWVPPGWNMISQTATDAYGMYYFRGVPPGQYVVQVNNQNFSVTVFNGPFQELPPIFVRRF